MPAPTSRTRSPARKPAEAHQLVEHLRRVAGPRAVVELGHAPERQPALGQVEAGGRTGVEAGGRAGVDAVGRTGVDAIVRSGFDAVGHIGVGAGHGVIIRGLAGRDRLASPRGRDRINRPRRDRRLMAFAEINGQRIRFEDSGGDGPPVILSHGFLMDREMFAPQVDALAPEFRVITWDERGFGETEFDGEPFTYWDSARDCLGLLDHLGIERAVLGGMSQGGFLSMRAALLAPERVRALVLIDTQSGSRTPSACPPTARCSRPGCEAGPVDELTEAVANLIIGDPALNEVWIAKWRQLPRESLRAPGDCLFERDDITDRLGEISCPAIVFHGTADLSIEMERAEELCRGLPGCTGVVQRRGRPARRQPHPSRPGQRAAAGVPALTLSE